MPRPVPSPDVQIGMALAKRALDASMVMFQRDWEPERRT
jgi:hypothetical protein